MYIFPKQSLLYGVLTEKRVDKRLTLAGALFPKQSVLPAGDV